MAKEDSGQKWRDIRIFHATDMLDRSPGSRRAIMTMQGPGDYMIVTVAIRGAGAGELHIPINNYEPWRLLDLINKHEGANYDVPGVH